MNRIPVLLTFDRRIILGAAVTIKSLLATSADSTTYEIHVFHSDLPSDKIDAFESLTAGTRHVLVFHSLDKSRFKGFPKNRGSWTEIVYYKLLAPEILLDHDKIIYSDVDVCFMRDLSEVYGTNIADYDWAGVPAEKNWEHAIGHRFFPENGNDMIFMTGFMLMNLKRMRERQMVARLLETVRRFHDRLKFFELDTLNIACDRIKPLPFAYVVLETVFEFSDITRVPEFPFLSTVYSREQLESAKRDPAIIHYAGKMGKPWHRRDVPRYYQNYVNSLPRALRVTTLRDFRKKWFGLRRIKPV